MRQIDADELKTAFPCGEYVKTENVRATIDHMPTIDAVPMDKLCEWLDKNDDFVPYCDDDKADCNSCDLEGAECLKKRIVLGMEEQNA